MRRRFKEDVAWCLLNRKRPIAYSTKAASDLIVALADGERTIQEVYDAINYDPEAKAILKIYIEKGYGDEVAQHHFK